MPSTHLFLIRHGEVEKRYQGVFGGRIDMNLSGTGRRQAERLAHYLDRHKFDAAYASPMKRVQQTVAPSLGNGMPKPVILDGLREVDFGDWSGMGWADVQARFGISAYDWLNALDQGAMSNAETGAQFRKRLEPVLSEILQKHPGKRVAVFCHGGVVRMVLSILLELPLVKTDMFEVDYASVTWIELRSRGPEIQLLNFTPWRDT